MILPDAETCHKLADDVASVWRWFDGMKTTRSADRLGDRLSRHPARGWGDSDDDRVGPADRPDFTDPLTALGAELVLQVVWGDVPVDVIRYADGWAVTRPPIEGAPGLEGMLRKIVARGATRLEATIAAILAAPVREGA